MKIAAAAYPLTWLANWAAYEAKIRAWVDEAAVAGADLLVFPEYAQNELASLGGAAVAADLEGALRETGRHRPAADRLLADLARKHGVHILSGSGPVWENPAGRPVNRATMIAPEGVLGHQDKAMMTRFEREDWDVVGGDGLKVFDTALGRIGVVICYDSEFPLLSRAMVEQGVELLLAPSATETFAGFMRVRVGSMARALENQCVVIHSPLVGKAPWCVGLEENTGRASAYGPPDRGFPETGILAEGALGQPGWTYADVDLNAVRTARADGVVLTHAQWPEQASRVARVSVLPAPSDSKGA